jgi:aspartate--ammonia ligase
METTITPPTLADDYTPVLDLRETQEALTLAKSAFERELTERLDLQSFYAPWALRKGTGLQDDLAGTQEPVGFTAQFDGRDYEIVHSLAKWKRQQLHRYDLPVGRGLLAELRAIRKDEAVDATRSIHVDQWDWERVLTADQRTLAHLQEIVSRIYAALRTAIDDVTGAFPVLGDDGGPGGGRLPDEIPFVHTEELERLMPELSPEEREEELARQEGAAFVLGIGHPLPQSGEPHDLRAVDYDDWVTPTEKGPGLNGDIIVWDDVRETALELSSMGIRVDAEALAEQMEIVGRDEDDTLPYRERILDGTLPLSVGGGIGQSRVAMFLLKKAHIGEVQPSAWPDETVEAMQERGVPLL